MGRGGLCLGPGRIRRLPKDAWVPGCLGAWVPGCGIIPVTGGPDKLAAEATALYDALGNDTYGPRVRLEQELINWD
ncbi:UNVERIFIED_ORG: hypothetical protein ABIB52_000579 [Arthrobacter sp. UYCu721]